MAVQAQEVLGTFHGDESFPIEWEPGEAELFWVLDDLHCPNPLSPLFFDLGGWWLTCDHMFRRFATPFAADWVAKNVNGYLYTAAIPADPSVRPEANEFQARYAPRVPHDPEYAGQDGRVPRLRPAALRRQLPRLVARPAAARDRAQLRLPGRVRHRQRLARRAGSALRGRARHPRPALEDPLAAQLRAVLGDDGAERDRRRGQGRGRSGAARPPAELRRGPELGLDRGALADEGGDQGRRRAARGASGARRPPTCSARSRAPSAAAASSTSG